MTYDQRVRYRVGAIFNLKMAISLTQKDRETEVNPKVSVPLDGRPNNITIRLAMI